MLLLIKPFEVAKGQASWLKEVRSSTQLAGAPTCSTTAPCRGGWVVNSTGHQINQRQWKDKGAAATSSPFPPSPASSHPPLPCQHNNNPDSPLHQLSGRKQRAVMLHQVLLPMSHVCPSSLFLLPKLVSRWTT